MESTFWGIFWVLVPFLLWLDFSFNKGEISFKRSLWLSAGYISVALIYGTGIYFFVSPVIGVEYFTAYTLEKSLSVDNLFVISQIMIVMAIPAMYQHKVLLYGIIGAIIFRGVFIYIGAELVHQLEWVLLIFAAFLVYIGLKSFKDNDDDDEKLEEKRWYKWIINNFPFTKKLHGDRLVIRRENTDEKLTTNFFIVGTPLLLCIFAVEISDLIFAIDSIPAALAVSDNMLAIFTSNIFAVLGLRALFFAVANVINEFDLMEKVVGVLLAYIGFKVFYNFFATEVYKIEASTSLIITLTILSVGFFFAWRKREAEKNHN